jgi:hypothetical protein
LTCPLDLINCYFDSTVILEEADARSIRFTGSEIPGIVACQLATRGDFVMEACRITTSGVNLDGARIGGNLVCTGAIIDNQDGRALSGESLRVEGEVRLDGGFEAKCETRLAGARIKGQLLCKNATFRNSTGVALGADGVIAEQGVFLNDHFRAFGMVRMVRATIGGQFACRAGEFHKPLNSNMPAFLGTGLRVDGDVYLDQGFESDGEVRLDSAEIHGSLILSQATLRNPGGRSLCARWAKVRDASLSDGMASDGELSLVGSEIPGHVSCVGARLSNGYQVALNLSGVHIAGRLDMQPASLQGVLDLTHAHVGIYRDTRSTWPNTVRLEGFSYRVIEQDVKVGERLVWLRRNELGYTPQIYDQLGAAVRLAGLEDDARRVGLAKQRDRRSTLDVPGRIWGLILDITVGYGYMTWLAGFWLIGLLAAGTLIFTLDQGQFRAARSGSEQPQFSALVLTLDLLLPVVTLHQRDFWLANGWLEAVVAALSILGWVLVTVVALSLTGLLKRGD